MRVAIMAAAFGLVIGAPVLAPTNFMSVAVAQAAVDTALQAELAAVANDPDTLAAIIAREMAAGNTDGVVTALAAAATALVTSDVAGAAALVIQAVNTGESAGDEAQEAAGEAASTVATTALVAGESETATNIEIAVASSLDVDVQMSYIDAGGTQGTNLGGGSDDDGGDDFGGGDQQGGDQQGGDQQGGDDTTTPTGDTTTPTSPVTPGAPGGPPPPPPNTGSIVLPVPIEPNPNQAGSPV